MLNDSPRRMHRLHGTLRHVGTSYAWNEFSFQPKEEGYPPFVIRNVFSRESRSLTAFALIGMIAVEPEITVYVQLLTNHQTVFLTVAPSFAFEYGYATNAQRTAGSHLSLLRPRALTIQELPRTHTNHHPVYRFAGMVDKAAWQSS